MKVIRSGRPAAVGEVGLHKKVRETGEFAHQAPGAQLRELSTGYPQEIYDRGVWEFDTIFVKSRSASRPSYSPGTWNTFFSPSSLDLHP